jgi:hypothetical protein
LATVSRDCRKLWPARSDDAMIVKTSGSCSRRRSARFDNALRRSTVGNAPPIPAITRARIQFRNRAAPITPNTRHATADATTNSPERSDTPAASSSTSSRSLNPRDSANLVPNFVTSDGIHPPA